MLSSVSAGEFLLNTFTSGEQSVAGAYAVASSASGSVAVWQSRGQDLLSTWGVFGQRFDAVGQKVGSEFLVNTAYLLDDQQRPAVAMGADGSFVVVWDGTGTLGLFPGIYAQRYLADGTPNGPTIEVAGSIALSVANASVGIDGSGNFVVAFEANDELFSRGVYERRYSSAGAALGSAFVVNPDTNGGQTDPALSVRADGSFVVAWAGDGTGDGSGVFARAYTSGGVASGGEVRLNQTTFSTQTEPVVRADSAGFMAAWSGNGTGDTSGVFMRRFDAAGSALSAEQRVNVTTTGAQSQPALALDEDGDLVVAWSGNGAGDGSGVFWREYAADLSPRTGERLLNTTTSGAQQRPAVASGGDNAYSLVWSGNGTGDSDGTFGSTLKNEAPVVTASSGSASFTEDGAAVAIDAGVTLSDADSLSLTSATISITGYSAGEDALLFTDQAGISGSWSSASGTLTMAGSASVAAYQTAIRSITYSNTSQNPATSARSISIRVHDGVDLSVAAGRGLTVTAVNDVPVATASAGSASFIEDGSAVALDSGMTVTDVDSATLGGVTVWFSAGYVMSEDSLEFTDQLGITGSWSAAAGTLTLAGVAVIADYQLALRSIAYVNSSQNPSTAGRTVSIIVHDGVDPGATVSRGVAVTAVNDAPVAAPSGGAASFVEDGGAVAVDAGIGVVDVDSSTLASASVRISAGYVSAEDELLFTDQLGITGGWDAGTGTLTLSGTAAISDYQAALRTVRYINLSQNPSTAGRTVSFVVSDGTDPSAAGTRALSVSAINDVPVVAASGGTASYVEDGAGVAVDAGISIGDVDSAVLVGAVIQISGGYTSGQDVLAYTDQLGIAGTWDGVVGTLTLTGAASPADYQTAVRSIVYLNSGQDPSTTNRTISFSATDGVGVSAVVTRGLSVIAVNDAPVVGVSGGTAAYTEDGAAAVIDAGLTVGDVDSVMLAGATVWFSAGYQAGQDTLVFVAQAGITGNWDAGAGVLTLSGAATLVDYQAALRSITYSNSSQDPSTAARTISFAITDGSDGSAPVSRSLSVVSINDAPVVSMTSGSALFVEDGSAVQVDAGVVLTDVDDAAVDGAVVFIDSGYVSGEDALLFTDQLGITGSWDSLLGVLTMSGSATLADYQAAIRSITYVNSSQNPTTALRTVAVVVSDGSALSSVVSRTIAVAAVNDAPVVAAPGGPAVFIEDGAGVSIASGSTVGDVDTAYLAGATIGIISGFVEGEDGLVFVDMLGISGAWDSSAGVLTLVGAASSADYQAALRSILYINNSQNPTAGSRGLAITVDDGSDPSVAAACVVSVTAMNDAPVVTASAGGVSFQEDGPAVTLDAGTTIGDVDSLALQGARVAIGAGYEPGEDQLLFTDMLGITGSWDSASGELRLTGTASLASYEAAIRSVRYWNSSQNPSGAARVVEWSVDDGGSASVSVSRVIAVSGVDDAPLLVVSAGPVTYTEKQPAVALDPAFAVVDVDSAALVGASVRIASGYRGDQDVLLFSDQVGISGSWDPVTGTLVLSGLGSLTDYAIALRSVRYLNLSAAPDSSPRSVELIADDGAALSAAAIMTLMVTAVNDAPVVAMTAGAVAYVENGGSAALDAGVTVGDVDSGALAWAIIRIASGYSAGDTLSFADQGGIVGSWDAVSGVLVLSGAASTADYQQALRSVMFTNDLDDPTAGPRSVEVVVSDGVDVSLAMSRLLDLAAVDDRARLTGSGAAVSYTDGDEPVQLDAGISLADPDSATAMELVARFINGYQPDGDVLLVGETRGLLVAWDAGTGTLRVTGSASIGDYAAVLRSLSYESRASALSPGAREVGLVVMSGSGASDELSVLLSVLAAPIVDPPEPPDAPDPPDAPEPPNPPDQPDATEPSDPPTPPDPPDPSDPSGVPDPFGSTDPPIDEPEGPPESLDDGSTDDPSPDDDGGDDEAADPFDLAGQPPSARSGSGSGDGMDDGAARSSESPPEARSLSTLDGPGGEGEEPSGAPDHGASPSSEWQPDPTTGDGASPTSSSSTGSPFEPLKGDGSGAEPVNEPPTATVDEPGGAALVGLDEGSASAAAAATQVAERPRGATSVVIVGEPTGVMSSAWEGVESVIDAVAGHRGSQVVLIGVTSVVFAWTSALWLPVGMLGARWSRAVSAELYTFDLALLLRAWERTQGRRSPLMSAGEVEEGA